MTEKLKVAILGTGNIGADRGWSIAKTAQIGGAQCQPPLLIHHIARRPEPGKPAERYVPSTQRGLSELGRKDSIDPAEALRRTLLYHRNPGGLTCNE